MSERFGPRTIDPALVEELWTTVKHLRDEFFNREMNARLYKDKLNELLDKMTNAGMNDWIPTLEEVQAAWRGDDQ